MRLALKRHGLDDFLPRLAQQAPLPHIRAVAYESLILGRARWFEGYRREWIDKRYNLWRRTPDFQERPLDHDLNIEQLITAAARDCAVVVRKVAGRGLIDLRHELSSEMIEIGKLLSRDKSASVRSRAEFYLKNLPHC